MARLIILVSLFLGTANSWIPSKSQTGHSRKRPRLLKSSVTVLRESRIASDSVDSKRDSVQEGHKQNPFPQPNDPTNSALLNQLEMDWNELTKLRPSLPSADPSITAAIVSAGSSYTRIWTHSTWMVHSNPPHWRYSRHVRKWRKSTTARKILPVVLLATCWSVIVSLLAKHWQIRPFQSVLANAGSASVVSLLSAPLALLLTLRANASMSRLLEARQAWGRLVSWFHRSLES